ncbi:hypothetical protein FHX09_000571 [Rhizobium sp. BK538]|nr:hypothetical protein [Rhizobium sp. BK538]
MACILSVMVMGTASVPSGISTVMPTILAFKSLEYAG